MKRYVLDTNVFIDAMRDRGKAEELEAFSSAFLPFLHLHAVVAQELLAGAVTPRWRREIEAALIDPFERRGRVVVPSLAAWKRSGEIVSELVARKSLTAGGVPRSFLNDALLAASCREQGLTLVTRNRSDFALIATLEPVDWTEPWPRR